MEIKTPSTIHDDEQKTKYFIKHNIAMILQNKRLYIN